MRHATPALALVAVVALPLGAQAQGYGPRFPTRDVEVTGSIRERDILNYDTGGANDRRPELLPHQRGGGQQTGGPARNLIPSDGFTIGPD